MKIHSQLPPLWWFVVALGIVVAFVGIILYALYRLGGWLLATVLVLVLATAFSAGAVFAQSGHHGAGHSDNHDWYRDLKQPGTGFSCCNGDTVDAEGRRREGDCRPVRAYLDDDGLWRALIDGRWVPVPPRVVLEQMGPDGNSHICASKSGMIYCFLRGSPKI